MKRVELVRSADRVELARWRELRWCGSVIDGGLRGLYKDHTWLGG